jgi:hypothetical protein
MPPGDVDAGLDPDAAPAELGAAGDPGQRLAGEPAGDEGVEPGGVAARRLDELGGLLVGGDEAVAGQQRGQLGEARRGLRQLWPWM